MAGQPLTVSQINLYLKTLVETDVLLDDVWIAGEITSVKSFQMGGQLYLTLSEGDAQLSCVVYESFFGNIKCPLVNGVKIRARGKIRFYQKRGTVTFQIAYAEPAGTGALAESFEKLKAKLTAEGLFDLARKRPLPEFPTRICVISSPESAGLVDFKTVLKSLAPSVQVIVIHAVMQGVQCRASVVGALKSVPHAEVEMVVIVRGGGSAEDLAWFNDEAIVRAISAARVPVLTAIGHEVDTTLSDYAADHRAATPTDAAKIIGFPFQAAIQKITSLIEKASLALNFQLSSMESQVSELISHAQLHLHHRVSSADEAIKFLLHRAHQANPAFRLLQGYSICRNTKSGKIIKSIQDVRPNDTITATVANGSISAVVTQTQL